MSEIVDLLGARGRGNIKSALSELEEPIWRLRCAAVTMARLAEMEASQGGGGDAILFVSNLVHEAAAELGDLYNEICGKAETEDGPTR